MFLQSHFLYDLSTTGTTLTIIKPPVQSTGAARYMGVVVSNTTFELYVEISSDNGVTWTQVKKISSSASAPYFADVSHYAPNFYRITAKNTSGGGGGSGVPGTIPGLLLWYKADSGLYQMSNGTTAAASNGDVVGYMTDYSGNNNHALQATTGNKPTVVTSGLNSLPVVRFTSTTWLSFTNVALSSGFTVYIVGNTIANTSFALGGGNGAYLGYYTTSGSYVIDDGQATAFNVGGSATTRAAVVRAHRPSTAAGTGYKTTGNTESTSGVGLATITLSEVMRRASPAVSCAGDIAEIIVYNSDLSTTDKSTIEAYILSKWGVAT